MINYNHFYYFWIIAKEGGVTAACKRLRLSQPTLSAQLTQFEKFIGSPLFERRSRKLILNDKGKIVFEYADSIFRKGKEMIEVLQDSSLKDIIKLNIGVAISLPKKNIHSYLKIPLAHRKVNLSLVEGEQAKLLENLKINQLDIVLSNEPAPKDIKGFYSHCIEKAPVIFIASPDYKNLRRKFPLSLQDQNLFLPTHPAQVRTSLDMYLANNQVKPRLKGEVQNTEMLRVIAVSGHGVVAIPRSSVSDLIKSKEIYIIGDNIDVFSEFYLITTEKKVSNPVVKDMLKKLS